MPIVLRLLGKRASVSGQAWLGGTSWPRSLMAVLLPEPGRIVNSLRTVAPPGPRGAGLPPVGAPAPMIVAPAVVLIWPSTSMWMVMAWPAVTLVPAATVVLALPV